MSRLIPFSCGTEWKPENQVSFSRCFEHKEVQAGWLVIEYGPLPWPNAYKRYPLVEIEQLYCKETVTHSDSGQSFSYEVHALMTHNRNVKLVTALKEPEQALYIEQEIERYLRIQDRPVARELPR